jgi:hypothetical protein
MLEAFIAFSGVMNAAHIHRPRHRRLLVPLLGPPSLVAGPEGSPGSPQRFGTPLLWLQSAAVYRFCSSATFVRDAPLSGASSAALQDPGLPKRARMRISTDYFELRKRMRELFQQYRKFPQNIR